MQIIIEGPDGSGKTTLVQKIHHATGWPIIYGQGPEKYPGEIPMRIQTLLELPEGPKIFDRHPCISDRIYRAYSGKERYPETVYNQVYENNPLIIYCQPPDPSSLRQTPGLYDTLGFVKILEDNYPSIVRDYQEWALERADLIYRYWKPHNAVHYILELSK